MRTKKQFMFLRKHYLLIILLNRAKYYVLGKKYCYKYLFSKYQFNYSQCLIIMFIPTSSI